MVDPGMMPVAKAVVPDPQAASAEASATDESSKQKRKGWWSQSR